MTALGNLESLGRFSPELALVAGLLAVLALTFSRAIRGRRGWVVAGTVAAAACAGAAVASWLTADGEAHGLFGGLIARDGFADFFKLLAPLTGVIVIVLSLAAPEARDPTEKEAPEFFALLLAAILGTQLMAAATDLLMLYLALELVSLSSYALTGFVRGSRRSAEAALKYVVYGGVASATMLYGLSLLYGLAGTLDLATVRVALQTAPGPLALAGVVLVLAGLGFKVAAVPFHAWCPDVYEGAPTAVTAFLSVAPKAGGFALLLRFFAAGAPAVSVPWDVVALVVAVLSMTLGNLGALGQRNIKRLLAYSSIAQAGYLFLGLAARDAGGTSAMLFYLGGYLFANLAAFGVVIAVTGGGGSLVPQDLLDREDIGRWAGLSRRAPALALVMVVSLLSLAGLPPTVGFVGKYYLLSALIVTGRAEGSAMHVVAALLAAVNTVVSLAYYLRIVRAMYLDADTAAPLPSPASPSLSLSPERPPWIVWGVLGGLAVVTVAFGIYWAPLDALVDASLAMWTPAVAR